MIDLDALEQQIAGESDEAANILRALVRAVRAALVMDDTIEKSWSDDVFGLRSDEWTDALEPFEEEAT